MMIPEAPGYFERRNGVDGQEKFDYFVPVLFLIQEPTIPRWSLTEAAEINRAALLRVLAMLAACLAGGSVPRHLHATVTRLLRPAESAVRRLIVIWGREVLRALPAPLPSRPAPAGTIPQGTGTRPPVFPLFDRRWDAHALPLRASGPQPRILDFLTCQPAARQEPAPSPDDPVDARGLMRRIEALNRTLDDLPGQARRMARRLARCRTEPPGPRYRASALRTGQPPGGRKRHQHEIDGILDDCHRLALHALHPPETSLSRQTHPPP